MACDGFSSDQRAALLDILVKAGRVNLLAHLKHDGVALLPDRQAIANVLSKELRGATQLLASHRTNRDGTAVTSDNQKSEVTLESRVLREAEEFHRAADADVIRQSGSVWQTVGARMRTVGDTPSPTPNHQQPAVNTQSVTEPRRTAKMDVSDAPSSDATTAQAIPATAIAPPAPPPPSMSDEERVLHAFDAFHRRHAWKVLAPVESVVGMSDLHADVTANMNVLLSMPSQPDAAIVIAGDAATDLGVLDRLITTLVSKFKHVCYVAGNHELWTNPRRTAAMPLWDGEWMKIEAPSDGLSKLLHIMERVTALGAHAYPVLIGGAPGAGGSVGSGVALVPLHSWFQPNFLGGQFSERDREMGRMMAAEGSWPPWLEAARQFDCDAVSKLFARLNRCAMADITGAAGDSKGGGAVPRGTPIVSFSHFLPEPALHRGYTWLSHYEGSHALGAQVRELSAAAHGAACTHVFGHTHFSLDTIINGVRYVQQPLGNPAERANGWQIRCNERAPYKRVWP